MSSVRDLSPVTDSDFPTEWYEISDDGHFWLAWRFRAFLNQLQALGISRQTSWRGLDVGCGHGVVRRQIEELTTWTTDGADLNRAGLEQNRTRSGESLLYDIHDRRPELAEKYDFILMFDVIEHVDQRQRFLASALHHLAPGGWLFINVPALESMRSGYDVVVGHLRRYNKRTLREELGPLPLVVRDVRYWGFAMLPYLFFRKLTSPLGEPRARVIQHGFLPPRPWMNAWILRIMRMETALLKTPFLGTSLLAAATKTGSDRPTDEATLARRQ
jgi:SAM-dependent methyltransferase